MTLRRCILVPMVLAALSAGGLHGQSQPAAPARWTLTREIRIGSEAAGPQYQFTAINAIAVDRDNSVYVVDPLVQEIRQFDARGVFVRAIGRKGQGPGEFGGLSDIGWHGDTLYAIDGRRITRFARDGTVISVVPWVPVGLPAPLAAGSVVFALLADGSTLGSVNRFQGPDIMSGKVPGTPVFHFTGSGRLLDTLSWAKFQKLSSANWMAAWVQPFGDGEKWAWSPGTARVAIVDRTVPAAGAAATFGVTVVAVPHDTVFSRRYAYAPRPVPRSVVDSTLAAIRTNGGTYVAKYTDAQIREYTWVPASYPPIAEAFMGADGSVWLQRESAPSAQWTVIAPDGRLVASTTMPNGMRPLLIAADVVWGVETDSSDVPSLVRYRIGR